MTSSKLWSEEARFPKKFADDIGAEGYSVNAVEAVKVAKELTGIA